jgi:hypothetical protein
MTPPTSTLSPLRRPVMRKVNKLLHRTQQRSRSYLATGTIKLSMPAWARRA